MASRERCKDSSAAPQIIIKEIQHPPSYAIYSLSLQIYLDMLDIIMFNRNAQELIAPVHVMIDSTAPRVIAFIQVNHASSSKIISARLIWLQPPMDLDVLRILCNRFEAQRLKSSGVGIKPPEQVRVECGQSDVQTI